MSTDEVGKSRVLCPKKKRDFCSKEIVYRGWAKRRLPLLSPPSERKKKRGKSIKQNNGLLFQIYIWSSLLPEKAGVPLLFQLPNEEKRIQLIKGKTVSYRRPLGAPGEKPAVYIVWAKGKKKKKKSDLKERPHNVLVLPHRPGCREKVDKEGPPHYPTAEKEKGEKGEVPAELLLHRKQKAGPHNCHQP